MPVLVPMPRSVEWLASQWRGSLIGEDGSAYASCRVDPSPVSGDKLSRRSDRRLLVGIVAFTLGGIACLTVGIWGLSHGSTADWPYPMMGAPFGAVVGGLFLSGFGLAALTQRLRSGPQSPGRHSREDDR